MPHLGKGRYRAEYRSYYDAETRDVMASCARKESLETDLEREGQSEQERETLLRQASDVARVGDEASARVPFNEQLASRLESTLYADTLGRLQNTVEDSW